MNAKKPITRLFLTTALLAGGALQAAHAAEWPDKAIQLVVSMAPGGSNDYLARAVAQPLGEKLGQTVVIENRSGADGRIGTGYVARQPADGNTLGLISVTHVIHPSLFNDIPYDILADFQPVGLIAHTPFVLVVGPALGQIKTPQQFVEYARAHPGEVTYGSSGVGSPFHLGGELIAAATGVDMLHVPFRGSGPLLPALLGGDVMAAVVPVGPFLKQIEAGNLRALGLLADAPDASLPAVPTLNQELQRDDLTMLSWLGLVAPAETPRTVIQRLNEELQVVLRDPAFVSEKLSPQFYRPLPGSSDDMRNIMSKDAAMYKDIIEKAGISVN